MRSIEYPKGTKKIVIVIWEEKSVIWKSICQIVSKKKKDEMKSSARGRLFFKDGMNATGYVFLLRFASQAQANSVVGS